MERLSFSCLSFFTFYFRLSTSDFRLGVAGSQPAVLRQVDGHAVGPGELDLDITALLHLFRSRVGAVHGAGFLVPRPCPLRVLDLETEMVDPRVPGGVLRDGGVLVLEFQDREVDVAVAQVIALGRRRVELPDLLQSEPLDVETRRCVRVPGADCDVTDAGHRSLPAKSVMTDD